MELSGVAIVTGAGGGIGSAVAERLAAEGCSLVLADRDPASLAAAGERARGAARDGVVVRLLEGDVGDVGHHAALVAAAEDLGGLALSVLNAGVYLPGLSWEMPLGQWELQTRVNYWGVVHGVRAAVPVMLARGRGHVVAVASGAGLVATPGLAPYVATKHAVVGLMESLHHELVRVQGASGGTYAGGDRGASVGASVGESVGESVGASVVCPGNVRTPMAANSLAAAGVDDERLDGVAASVARAVRAGNDAGGDPATVADAVVAAVREGRFWVLPQPEVGLGALDRFQRLARGDAPVDLLPPGE